MDGLNIAGFKILARRATSTIYEKAVKDIAYEQPAWGQTRASNELKQRGISISGAGVRGIRLRSNLEKLKKRL